MSKRFVWQMRLRNFGNGLEILVFSLNICKTHRKCWCIFRNCRCIVLDVYVFSLRFERAVFFRILKFPKSLEVFSLENLAKTPQEFLTSLGVFLVSLSMYGFPMDILEFSIIGDECFTLSACDLQTLISFLTFKITFSNVFTICYICSCRIVNFSNV